MTTALKDHECEITWNGKEYLVEADVFNCGFYEVIPMTKEAPEEIDILEDPEWHNMEVIDLETGEPVGMPDSAIVNKAVEVLNNIYWDRICWGPKWDW